MSNVVTKRGALEALAPYTAELLEKLAGDFAGEQFAPNKIPAGEMQFVCWKDVLEEMPDDETSVLVFAPTDDEPIWIGFHEDGKWRCPSGCPLVNLVTHWAHFPNPPTL